jgi:hypothetical protein
MRDKGSYRLKATGELTSTAERIKCHVMQNTWEKRIMNQTVSDSFEPHLFWKGSGQGQTELHVSYNIRTHVCHSHRLQSYKKINKVNLCASLDPVLFKQKTSTCQTIALPELRWPIGSPPDSALAAAPWLPSLVQQPLVTVSLSPAYSVLSDAFPVNKWDKTCYIYLFVLYLTTLSQ